MEIQKTKQELILTKDQLIINSVDLPSYSIKDGDFIIEKNHCNEIFKVRINEDTIEVLRESGSIYSRYKKERTYSEYDYNYFAENYIVLPIKSFSDDEVNKVLLENLSKEEKTINENCYSLVSKKQSDMIVIRDKQFDLVQRQKVLNCLIKYKQEQISSVARKLEEQLNNMNTILNQIHLYNDIVENIVQIQEGITSDATITIRQKILFMDEEITHNDVDNSEFDYKDVTKFDKWLLLDHEKFNKKNYEIMLPEEKGIVVFRVRRNDIDYRDPFSNEALNSLNKKYYVFLRNGTNLYRIFTDNYFGENLLPTEKDFELMQDERKGDKAILSARQNMIVIQGIIDNTTILESENFKIVGQVNLLDSTTYEGKINPIFDNENIIAPLQTYREYQKEINKEIEIGSRIVFFNEGFVSVGSSTSSYYKDKGVKIPAGIYTVVGYGKCGYSDFYCYDSKVKTNYFKVMAYADNLTNESEGGKKARYIYMEDCFNYDLLDIEKIENFMYDRISRQYVSNLPKKIKLLRKLREAEKHFEDGFVENLKLEYSEKQIREAIEWWKLKNKFKRGLMNDDSKALRMIKKYLK